MKYRILVACGTGAATSTHVAVRLKEELHLRGIDVITTQCTLQDVEHSLTGMDIVVTTSKVEDDYDIPLFTGIPFLTGMGTDQLLDQIVNALKKRKENKEDAN